jgi:hypothetical protein
LAARIQAQCVPALAVGVLRRRGALNTIRRKSTDIRTRLFRADERGARE